MSCRSSYRGPIGLAAIVAVLLILIAAAGCGRKGDPLPPLREPEPVAEAAPGEEEAIGVEPSESAASSESEGGDEEDDGETSSKSDPNDGGDDEDEGEGHPDARTRGEDNEATPE